MNNAVAAQISTFCRHYLVREPGHRLL